MLDEMLWASPTFSYLRANAVIYYLLWYSANRLSLECRVGLP
jgi:hypothetical protein